jgi:3-isopropylmalate/(R)-2-methylmalate dehydratase large subunit
VVAKDAMLFLCGRMGMEGGRYEAVEYAGDAIAALPMQERMTLANMTAELGGQTGLIAPDETTAAWLREAGADPGDWRAWCTDPDAAAETHEFDAASLEPQVAAPHSPANAAPVGEHRGERIAVAYIGACTGAKLEDLRMAATVLRDRKTAAGARLRPNACGICAGYGAELLGEDVVAISSTARNFRGRMGAPSSRVFLASPYTVAAAAVAGHIVDPREIEP